MSSCICSTCDTSTTSRSSPVHEVLDPAHRALDVLGVEAAEPLVQEEGVEPAAAARDHLGQREGQRERGEERLAARQRVGLADRAAGVDVDDPERARPRRSGSRRR